ncbi:hypothetical protein F4820DRAFT_443629 [Hypoxylon rubiginosum]|uniref:Uncharacterized protein n=1 Tax=Hypoxylon rubiginosum TaxID=110542 RepID=A0ACB9ZDZ2_9PEZI|nr:hypothetical protein F4820DRAFT_443629 [Hypoxylon rubiginosum]
MTTTQLIEHLESVSPSRDDLEFIPCPGPTSNQFLFNIAKNTDIATADTFVAFTDTRQTRPCKEVRQSMLTNTEYLSQYFLSFNSFVDRLQFSATLLGDLATQSRESSTSNQSFPTFALLQKFRRKIAAAYRAILSHAGSCTNKPMKHRIPLQLPGWGWVKDTVKIKASQYRA